MWGVRQQIRILTRCMVLSLTELVQNTYEMLEQENQFYNHYKSQKKVPFNGEQYKYSQCFK